MKNTYFITGISTDVGKTIASAILTEALHADYWKPIQAGDLENSDTHKVKRLISNKTTQFHPNSYALKTPMSPHAAAKIDTINIELNHITTPKTNNHLIIEGAGGLFVPINDTNTIADLIYINHKIIVVSKHYLGSINHTLLTINALKQKGFNNIALLYSGDEHKTTESIIKKMTNTPVIGRINDEPYFDQNVILDYAQQFKNRLLEF